MNTRLMTVLCSIVLLGFVMLGFRHAKGEGWGGLTTPIQAEGIDVGQGLICDTKEQVEEYVAFYNEGDGTFDALMRVNARADPPPCGIVQIAYIKGEEVGRLQMRGYTVAIVPVMIVGINLGAGWVHGSPLPQFTIIRVNEREA
jgi:hypothetical protein